MRFKKVCKFKLMTVGESKNKTIITEEMINTAINNKVFDNAPIIFNDEQFFTDYTDDNQVLEYMYEYCCGVVLPDTASFDGLCVTADVMLLEEMSSRTYYDNWIIEMDPEKDAIKFHYVACELFTEGEIQDEIE